MKYNVVQYISIRKHLVVVSNDGEVHYLVTFAFDINRDLLIKDLIKFEVFGSKISSVNKSTMYGRVTYIVQSSIPLLFEAWGGAK